MNSNLPSGLRECGSFHSIHFIVYENQSLHVLGQSMVQPCSCFGRQGNARTLKMAPTRSTFLEWSVDLLLNYPSTKENVHATRRVIRAVVCSNNVSKENLKQVARFFFPGKTSVWGTSTYIPNIPRGARVICKKKKASWRGSSTLFSSVIARF